MDIEANPVIEKIKERFANIVQGVYTTTDKQLIIVIDKKSIVDVCKFLKETPEFDFSFMTDLTALDFPDRGVRFEVVYNLFSISQSKRIFVKANVGLDDLVVPSVTGLWASANWAEREVYDMFGIKFSGHPNLKRLLMPEDFDGHPLRKEFPLEGYEENSKP
ncbi:MAG: NADH-quinone oxidoreductase subunit C [bacterium]